MIDSLPQQLHQPCRKFIEAGGHTTQSFGFGRILGQLYALLYLSPRPLCLDEIAAELGVSKASVSTTVRQLQSWAAVKRVWVKGDRKDYYEAETDFNGIIRNGLLGLICKKLDTAGTQIANVETSLQGVLARTNGEEREQIETVAKRLQKAREFHARVNALLNNPLLDHVLASKDET